jgi:hypothetical protein
LFLLLFASRPIVVNEQAFAYGYHGGYGGYGGHGYHGGFNSAIARVEADHSQSSEDRLYVLP